MPEADKPSWTGAVWPRTKACAETAGSADTPLAGSNLPAREGSPTEQARGAADDGINKEALRAKILVTNLPKVSFDDIKGQNDAVSEIRNLAERLEFPEIYKTWGAQIPRGVLLIGPPGTGKTMLAQALANSAGYAFLDVSCSDINNKYFGNPEKYAEGVFDIAEEEADKHPSGHCILFLDEVDALLKERDDQTFDAAENVLSIFLTRLNGLSQGGKVILVAATNRPDKLDSAFISRMNKVIEVALPKAEGVSAIAEVCVTKREKEAGRKFSDEIDFKTLGERLVGLSGRDLDNLINEVVENKAEEHVLRIKSAKAAGKPLDSVEAPSPVNTLDIIRTATQAVKVQALIGPRRIAELRSEFNLSNEAIVANNDAGSNVSKSTHPN